MEPMIPMYLPIFGFGETVSAIIMPIGTNKPVPMDWMMRPASTKGKFGASAVTIPPITSVDVVARKSGLVPKRVIKNPAVGVITAAPSM